MVAELKEQGVFEAPGTRRDDTSPGSLRKLSGILFQPTATFQEINKQPAWLLALLAATLVRFAETLLFFHPLKSPLGFLLTFVISAIPSFFVVLTCSGVFILALYLCGAETSFGRVFAVLAHTFFVYSLAIGVLRGLMLCVSADAASIDFQNPIASNLGFLLDAHEHLALQYLASSVDLIVFYHLYLIGLGLSMVAGKMSRRSAMALAVGIWALYVGVTFAIKAMVA